MENQSTFDVIFQGSPFLAGLVQQKITQQVAIEVASRDVLIASLQDDAVSLNEELTLAKARITDGESAINMLLEA